MFSRRTPSSSRPNEWSTALAARRAAGAPLVDLTETNPTRVGLASLPGLDLSALADPVNARYEPDPLGDRRAREAVSAYLAARGDRVSPESIVLTSGTSESYAHLFRLLVDPGERVAVPSPSYPLFAPIAAAEGVEVVPFALEYHGRWRLDLDSLERALDAGARAVVVVEPNHPTGSVLDAEEWRAFESACVAHGAAIVVDEVFADFGWDPARSRFASRAGERRALTFTLGGLSKSRGLPQLKLGWITVSGPETERRRALDGLEWLADLFLSVGSPVQHALPRLLAGSAAFQVEMLARIRGNLACLDALVTRHPELDRLRGEGGWAAILRCPERRDDESWALALLERGVAIHPGHFYDLDRGATLVASLIVPRDAMEAGVDRLASLLDEG